MAHIGFPVPAEKALLPRLSRVLTRLGTEDNLEGNASTFSVEMCEMSKILNVCKNSKSNELTTLVLIDELGRGTSPMEGASIAWSCLEKLVQYNCLTLFVTHFTELLSIPKQVPEKVKLYRFLVEDSVEPESEKSLMFETTHRLKEIYWEEEDHEDLAYGIKLAIDCGMPSNIIDSATKFRRKLLKTDKSFCDILTRDVSLLKPSQLESFIKFLKYLLKTRKISENDLNEKLQQVEKAKNIAVACNMSE